MNYTKQVREYCEQHNNSFIDISIVKDSVFKDIPYKTLLKIFNRLEDEEIVYTVSKGVYGTGSNTTKNDDILIQYAQNGKGMIVGYALFNSIGLTIYKDNKIEIYTNAIAGKQKTIGDFLLKRVDLEFTDEIVDLISLLEILDVGFNIEGVDYLSHKRMIELLALTYTDDNFRKVLAAIRYKYSTILKLNELLNGKQIDNCCIEVFNKINSFCSVFHFILIYIRWEILYYEI